MEYKVGDRFKCISDDLFFFDVGEIYQMKEIDSNSYCLSALNNQYMYVSPSFLRKNFEKVEEDDLRDLLKVGYMYTTTDDKYYVSNLYNLHFAKEKRDKNLKGLGIWKDIIAIHKPKYNGIKPMEWELVWERKEPKYYLRSWIDEEGNILEDVFESEYNYLNFGTDDKTLFFSSNFENGIIQTQFTQEEIDELPNQEFIKTLVKEEIR